MYLRSKQGHRTTVKWLSIASNFVELGDKLKKHTLQWHQKCIFYCGLIRWKTSHVILLRAFFSALRISYNRSKLFPVLINLRLYLELWLLSLWLFWFLSHGTRWKKHLVTLVSKIACSPFPLPWLTFQFHTGLSTPLQKRREEPKSIIKQQVCRPKVSKENFYDLSLCI